MFGLVGVSSSELIHDGLETLSTLEKKVGLGARRRENGFSRVKPCKSFPGILHPDGIVRPAISREGKGS